jgi:predicted GTPase
VALGELFIPDMPQVYHAAARILGDPPGLEEGGELDAQFAVHQIDRIQHRSKIVLWLHLRIRWALQRAKGSI